MTDTADSEGDFEERLHTLGAQIKDATQPLGLYLRSMYLPPNPDQAHTGQVVVVAEFDLNEIAFSDRVQNPEKYRQDNEVRELSAELGGDAEAEALREEWRRRGLL
jgi:hypothetical protein